MDLKRSYAYKKYSTGENILKTYKWLEDLSKIEDLLETNGYNKSPFRSSSMNTRPLSSFVKRKQLGAPLKIQDL